MIYDRYLGQFALLAGNNDALATTYENLSEHSTLVDYNAVAANAAKVQVTSSSAADAAAGTGARTVAISGLDTNYIFQTETITLNGQAYVESVGSYRRIFTIEVVTTGSGGVNAGDIYLIVTGTGGTLTGGVPTTLTSIWCKMLVGRGYSASGIFTVPAGRTYGLHRIQAGAAVQPGIITIYCKPLGASLYHCQQFTVGTNTNMVYEWPTGREIVYPEKTDVYLRALSTTAAGRMSAILSLKWLTGF